MTNLDPDVARVLDELTRQGHIPDTNQPADALRDQFREMTAFLRPRSEDPFDGAIEDAVVDGPDGDVRVRIYEPPHPDSADQTLVFIHGGGWMLGDLDSADPNARALANHLSARVVSVDYRLAPEHPFPAAYDDCLAVVEHVARWNNSWLGLAGDSAGGNLAAAIALTDRSAATGVDAQLLIYPALDDQMQTRSHQRYATDYLLTEEALELYWHSYQGGSPLTDPRFAPANARDLTIVPPTIVTTAGFDPLKDEAQEFAARLVGSGVDTTYLPAPALTHGWLDLVQRAPAASAERTRVFRAFDELRERTRRSGRNAAGTRTSTPTEEATDRRPRSTAHTERLERKHASV